MKDPPTSAVLTDSFPLLVPPTQAGRTQWHYMVCGSYAQLFQTNIIRVLTLTVLLQNPLNIILNVRVSNNCVRNRFLLQPMSEIVLGFSDRIVKSAITKSSLFKCSTYKQSCLAFTVSSIAMCNVVLLNTNTFQTNFGPSVSYSLPFSHRTMTPVFLTPTPDIRIEIFYCSKNT